MGNAASGSGDVERIWGRYVWGRRWSTLRRSVVRPEDSGIREQDSNEAVIRCGIARGSLILVFSPHQQGVHATATAVIAR